MNLDPQPVAIRQLSADSVEIDLAVPASLPCFADHFPRYPMLPGVLQLGWAVQLAQKQLGIATTMHHVSQLKFQHPIRPDMALTLSLTRSGDDVAFRYTTPAATCSAGKLVFAL